MTPKGPKAAEPSHVLEIWKRRRFLPENRRVLLAEALAAGRNIRLMEAHNGLSAMLASAATAAGPGGARLEFDGIWVSSLTTSAAKGLPDAELYSLDRRLDTIQEICASTPKIVVVDLDTGGIDPNLPYVCGRLEDMGVNAIVIEDKRFPKRNSLLPNDGAAMESAEDFAAKIAQACNIRLSKNFLIFGRIESLITGQGVPDALRRAKAYLEAGAAGLFIHSKAKTPTEILAFLAQYKQLCSELGRNAPLMVTPTTYSSITDDELFRAGAQIAIHANHLLRSAFRSMELVCKTILEHDRNLESEELCVPVSRLFEVVGNV
jgi:2-methylisocitrate lyase-like PEP mutase family enzyme